MVEAQADGIELEIEAHDFKTPSDWAPKDNEWGREERLIAYITTMRAKTQDYREIPCDLDSVFKRWKEILEKKFNHTIKGVEYVLLRFSTS